MTDAQNAAPRVSSAATMRDLFPGYYRPSVDTIVEYLRGGLVAVDANVLLSLYRYTPTAREQLLGALSALGERLWVPHQVALEYQRNRLSVQREQQTRATAARQAVEQLAQQSIEKLTALTNRAGVTPNERAALTSRLQQVYAKTGDRIEAMLAEAARQPDNPVDDDPVRAQLDQLLRVGPTPGDETYRLALTESKRRKDAKEPPGYKDTSHGDYLLWRQLLEEASRRRVPVVLVTDDRKEDWQRIENGQHLGALPALVDEMHRHSGQPFVLLESRTFLRLAGEHLQVPVSADTLEEASQAPAEDQAVAAAARRRRRDRFFNALVAATPQWQEIQRLLVLGDDEFGQLVAEDVYRLDTLKRSLRSSKSLADNLGRIFTEEGRAEDRAQITHLTESVEAAKERVDLLRHVAMLRDLRRQQGEEEEGE